MKLTILFMLACLQVSAQTNYVIFESGHYKGLKSAVGEEVLPPVFDNLGWTNGSNAEIKGLIGYQDHDKWGLISLDGKRITSALYDKLDPLIPGVFRVAIRGKFSNRYFYGLINDKGKLLLNLDYFDLELRGSFVVVTMYENNEFTEGAYTKSLIKTADTKYEQIEALGEVILARHPSGALDVIHSNGTLLASELESAEKISNQIITHKAGKVGLITTTGKVVYPSVHKSIDSHGKVQAFPKWSVQKTGDKSFDLNCDSLQALGQDVWLVHFNGHSQIYSRSEAFAEEGFKLIQKEGDFAVVRSLKSGLYHGLNEIGKTVVTSSDSIFFTGNYFIEKSENQWQVIHHSGKLISEKTFEYVKSMSAQFLAVKKYGYWAILDGIQGEVSDFRYDSISVAIDFSTIVKYVKKWGVHHPDNGWVIHPEYDQIDFANGHFVARKGRAYFLFSETGELLFQTIDELIPKPDYFLLKFDRKFTALGKQYKPMTETEYKSVTKIGDYFKMKKGDTTELYSDYGKRILGVRDRLEDVIGFSEEFFLIRKGGSYGFVDVNGKLRIANRYDSALLFSEGMAAVKIRGKWGFIDINEKLVIQPFYERVTRFRTGFAVFKLGGIYGLLDNTSKEILTHEYSSIQRTKQGNYLIKNQSELMGFVDSNGVTKLSARYQQIDDLGDGILRVKQNDLFGLFDYSGKNIISIQYDEIRLDKEVIYLKEANSH